MAAVSLAAKKITILLIRTLTNSWESYLDITGVLGTTQEQLLARIQ